MVHPVDQTARNASIGSFGARIRVAGHGDKRLSNGRPFADPQPQDGFMPNPNHPCIVIPGIKGTGSENIYALPPATTWSTWEAGVVVPDFDSLALETNAEAGSKDFQFSESLRHFFPDPNKWGTPGFLPEK
jgi:hypothetical protein